MQIYELLLYLIGHSDSTVVTAALETLHQLLRSPPALLLPVLTTVGSITRTSIYEHDVAALQQPKSGRYDFSLRYGDRCACEWLVHKPHVCGR